MAKYYPQGFFFCFLEEKTPPDFWEHVVAKYYPQGLFFLGKHPPDLWVRFAGVGQFCRQKSTLWVRGNMGAWH